MRFQSRLEPDYRAQGPRAAEIAAGSSRIFFSNKGRASALLLAAGVTLAGCGSHVAPAVPAPAAPAIPATAFGAGIAPEIPLTVDPTTQLIARVEAEYTQGQSEMALGHLVAAREALDRAVDLLLSAPGGAHSAPALEAEFEGLLDRVTALEAQALREGDGFTEVKTSPAVIDELLSSEPPKAAETTAELVASDLAQTRHDLPITVNPKVLSYVEYFTGAQHDFMQDALNRSLRYVPMIESVFKSEGVPLDLMYLPIVESAFQPTAYSRAAAKGLWQFEADTGKEQGLQLDWFRDERSDPDKATHAAAQYLKVLLDEFDGDWALTLAAYNAGPGTVERAIKRAKVTDYWKLIGSSRYLPRDTREYVPMVLASIIIARNPNFYGFDVEPISTFTFEKVTVPDALDLRVVAEWTGVSVDEIRALNPDLRRSMTPRGTHELKVPVGTAAAVEAKLAGADASTFVQFNTYKVKAGDTITTLANRFKVKKADLAQANQLKTTSRLQAGQTLIIPRDPAAAAPLSTPSPSTRPSATTASASTKAAAGPTTYRVKQGDTLSSIARQFDTTVQDLKKLNQLASDVIVIGDKLTVRR